MTEVITTDTENVMRCFVDGSAGGWVISQKDKHVFTAQGGAQLRTLRPLSFIIWVFIQTMPFPVSSQ